MKRAFLSILIQFTTVCVCLAGEQIQGASYPQHSGKSPMAFDKIATPSDTFIVLDTGPDNDDFRFRDDSATYEFTFELKIERYVGDVQKLKANNLISQKAKLYVPAFDVDQTKGEKDCDNDGILDTMNPEIDEVYFNGQKIGQLSGSNNVWDIAGNTFEIPIDEINLPGSPGDVATNTIQIKIDVGNQSVKLSSGQIGCQMWATEIDFVALDFDVVDPVALVVGLGGSAKAFEETQYIETLEKYGIPSFIVTHTASVSQRSCQQQDATSFPIHGAEIIQQLQAKSAEYKTNKFNIIAHSKGGLDSRYVANELESNALLTRVGSLGSEVVYNPIKLHSLTMLGTPNAGTIMADALAYNKYYGIASGIADIRLTGLSDYCDLSPARVNRYTQSTPLPGNIKVLLIGANADENNDLTIDEREAEFNQIPFVAMSNTAFKITGGGLRIETQYVDQIIYTGGLPIVVKVPKDVLITSNSIAPNDTMVRVDSALASRSSRSAATVGNHKTIMFEQSPGKPWSGGRDITINEGLTGALQWTVK